MKIDTQENEYVSDCCLTIKWAIFQRYLGENKLYIKLTMMMFAFFWLNIFIGIAYWNNLHWEDMLFHLDTLSWFKVNQSLLFLLNAVCFVEKQQIQILQSLVWPEWGSDPLSTSLVEHTNHNTTDAVLRMNETKSYL